MSAQQLDTKTSPLPAGSVWNPVLIGLLVLGAVVFLAMIGLGFAFLGLVQEVEDNQTLSDVLVDFSERPITSTQRDVLVLVAQLENDDTHINTIRNQRAIISNRTEGLRSPEQLRVRTDAVNEAIQELAVRWGNVEATGVTNFINDPDQQPADRDALVASLRDFEAQMNAVSLTNEVSRQSRAAELDNNTTDVLDSMRTIAAAFALTTVLLVVFGLSSTLVVQRSAREVFALNTVLEQRVKDRTRDLQIATDVSRQITTLLDVDTLIARVARETAERYELDGLMLFLMDDEKSFLNVRAMADKMGQALTVENFKGIWLDAKPSLVARAARERQPITADNVTVAPDYLAIKGLDDIKSEAVIPMVVGDRTLGVLEVFSKSEQPFTDDIMNALGIVANQTAIGLRNAELFAVARRARQEAEEANKAKSQFLAAMSHELRTPMNSVLNFTQFVVSGMFGDINKEQRDALEKSYSSGEHLLSLINDVLDISKIESNALQLYVEPEIPIDQILANVSPIGESMTKDKPKVSFSTEIEQGLPAIMADRQRMKQVLVNLVSNACKFTQEGTVKLMARKHDADHVRFIVQDTGPGIAKENQDKIFELFSQTKIGLRKGGGTGLGLAIARRLAEAHEGTLEVDSDVGKGATFTVTVPIKPASLEAIYRESQQA